MANRLSDVDWFMWNGVKSTTYGIHVLNQPNYPSPKERYTSLTIPGRSGSFPVLEGDNVYDNITVSIKCVIDDIFLQTHDYDIYGYTSANGFSTKDILRTYMSGEGKLTFPHMWQDNSQGVAIRRDYYKARLSNQINFDQVAASNPHRTFDLMFDCEPYIYLGLGDIGVELNEHAGENVFANEGNVPSKPLIRVVSTGVPITFRVYDYGTSESECLYTMTISTTPENSVIWIDCDGKVAYDESNPPALKTGYITGDWLEFPGGLPLITQTGASYSTMIYPRYRRI